MDANYYLDVRCNSNCLDSSYRIEKEDLIDIEIGGVFNRKFSNYISITYFIWGACFGAFVSTLMVYVI